jgi:hypothetical protein
MFYFSRKPEWRIWIHSGPYHFAECVTKTYLMETELDPTYFREYLDLFMNFLNLLTNTYNL